MTQNPLTILYVADPAASADFYIRTFGLNALQTSPAFSLLAFAAGGQLGLWRRDAVTPAASGTPGSSEIAVPVADEAALRALHGDLIARGAPILQALTALGFGTAFTASDPDGHRLRCFVPAA